MALPPPAPRITWTITFSETHIPDTDDIFRFIASNVGALPTMTRPQIGRPLVQEVRQLWTTATGGSIEVVDGAGISASFAYNAPANPTGNFGDGTSVQEKIQSLPGIDRVSVSGSGTGADPWLIVFGSPPDAAGSSRSRSARSRRASTRSVPG